ncbi:hypothetical protein AN643_01505 [Candidatus Epulonipiscioides saccharophilum]|nr:hypothetical protein AN643_01505 [Epulopiscium sp. SCG-B10WGA-EpuloB]
MDYIIGIDGGGTKTQLILCEKDNLNIIGEAISGPSNILSSGLETTRQSFIEVFQKGVTSKGYNLEHCKAICIGVAGGSWKSIQDQIEDIIREDIGYQGKLIITNDAQTALIAGTNGKEGILLIAGTGSICYGVNNEGKNIRVGGWGHIFDDKGSAYYIAIKILDSVMQAYDGRGSKTELTKLVLNYFEIEDEREIVRKIYQPNINKGEIADIAKLIQIAYENKDMVAMKIIDESVDELYNMVATSIRKLNFEEKFVSVIINGSVIIKNKAIREKFSNKLKQNYPKIEVKKLDKSAAYGAVIIAHNNLG